MTSLWDRMRQRRVVQWALAYLAGAWLVLQVLDVLGQNLGWPGWIFRVAIALLSVGFLAALVLAWYHGEQGRQRVSGSAPRRSPIPGDRPEDGFSGAVNELRGPTRASTRLRD